MATSFDPVQAPPRSFGVELAVALALSAIVYGEFWAMSIPTLPGPVPLVACLGVGVLVGILGAAIDARSEGRSRLDNPLVFGVAVLGLLMAIVQLYPNGLPLFFELGLLAAVWSGLLAQLIADVSTARNRA